MTVPVPDFAGYLEAKITVDDRALDRRIFERVVASLPERARVLEVAGGVGAMVGRLVGAWRSRWTGSPTSERTLDYLLLDRDPSLLQRASARLAQLEEDRSARGEELRLETVEADVFEWMGALESGSWDLVVASAFVDLYHVPTALTLLSGGLSRDGLLYLPITFDGVTRFEPRHELDDRILEAYHRTMRLDEAVSAPERGRDGARAGRDVLRSAGDAGLTVVDVAASDWIVVPRLDGRERYPRREDEFLAFLLATVEGALAGELPAGELEPWLEERRAQLEAAELALHAHHVDVLLRRGARGQSRDRRGRDRATAGA